MAKKFSLEAVLSLTDGMTAKITGIQKKMQGFSKGLSKTFQQNTFSDDFKKMGDVSGRVLAGVGVAAAGAAAGIAALVVSTSDSADKFAKEARTLGMSAESLQGLTYAAQMSGVESDALNKSLEKMSVGMGQARLGEGSMYTSLKKLNPQLLTQLRGTRDNNEAFLLAADAINHTDNAQQRAALSMAVFGKAGVGMVKMTSEGSKGISALTDEARRFGLISNSAAGDSENFQDNLTRFQYIIQGLKNKAFNALIPKVTELSTKLEALFFDSANGTSIIDQLSAEIAKINVDDVVKGFQNFAAGLRNVIEFIKFLAPLGPYILIIAADIKVATVVMGIFNAVAAANPLTLIILAIIAAVAALIIIIKLVADNWGAIVKAVAPILAGFIETIKTIGATILDYILAPFRLVLMALSKIPGMAEKIKPATDFMNALGAQSAVGKIASGTPIYASPTTRGSESRTYAESRSTSEVFVRPDRGAVVSPTRGGAPVPALNYGQRQ